MPRGHRDTPLRQDEREKKTKCRAWNTPVLPLPLFPPNLGVKEGGKKLVFFLSPLESSRKPKDARRRQDGVIFVEARRWAVRAATFCYVCLVIRHHLPKPHPARLCARRLGALPRLLRDGSHVQASSTGGAPCKRMSRTISARPSRTASWSLTVSCLLDANACRPQRGRCRRRTTGCKNRLGSTGRRPTDCVVAVQARWVR